VATDYLAMPEQWRAIPGLEGYYDASTHGRIRSVPRLRTRGRIRKLTPDRKGYAMIIISVEGKHTTYKVATLVARTFIGPRPPGQYVLHGPAGNCTTERRHGIRLTGSVMVLTHPGNVTVMPGSPGKISA